MPRGAPSWRGASADAPGSGDPGPPGVIVRAVRRDPDNASSRRVTPLVARGRKETGHPRARPKSGGQHGVGYATPREKLDEFTCGRSARRLDRWSDDSAAAYPPLEGEGRERSERGGVNAKRGL